MPRFELRAWRGDPLAGYGHWPSRSVRWGVHGKRAVIDDDIVLLGTYNIDPRSANFNSELMLICRGDRQFAGAVRADWLRRAAQSDVVVQNGHSAGVKRLLGDADRESLMLMLLGLPVSRLFDFLL